MSKRTIAFVGDVMLGRGVNKELSNRRPEAFWGTTLPLLRGADAVLANLECAITPAKEPWTRTRKVFHFRADPGAVETLKSGNIRCVALANNHILDFREQGLLDTIAFLDAAGIAHAGAGRTLSEAEAPVIVRLPDLTIAFVSMTDNEAPFAATERTSGTNYCDIEHEQSPATRLAAAAASCRAAGANLSVLSLHWGPNMVVQPPAAFRDFADEAIAAGFDFIHGHSAHVFQGVEIIRRRAVLYDTGDFIDDYVVDDDLRNDWSFIFFADIADGTIETIRMVPVRLRYARVDLAADDERDAICARMIRLSAALGTRAETSNGSLRIALSRNRSEAGHRHVCE